MPPDPRKRKTSLEKAKLVFKVLLIIGWFIAVVGVAIFTYSEAYPLEGKKPHQVGYLTLSQLGFWLIVAGICLVVISVGSSQGITFAMKAIKEEREALAVHAALGTGHEEESPVETQETDPLMGPNKVQYGSTSLIHAGPFISRSQTPSVITPSSNSSFPTKYNVAK